MATSGVQWCWKRLKTNYMHTIFKYLSTVLRSFRTKKSSSNQDPTYSYLKDVWKNPLPVLLDNTHPFSRRNKCTSLLVPGNTWHCKESARTFTKIHHNYDPIHLVCVFGNKKHHHHHPQKSYIIIILTVLPTLPMCSSSTISTSMSTLSQGNIFNTSNSAPFW